MPSISDPSEMTGLPDPQVAIHAVGIPEIPSSIVNPCWRRIFVRYLDVSISWNPSSPKLKTESTIFWVKSCRSSTPAAPSVFRTPSRASAFGSTGRAAAAGASGAGAAGCCARACMMVIAVRAAAQIMDVLMDGLYTGDRDLPTRNRDGPGFPALQYFLVASED